MKAFSSNSTFKGTWEQGATVIFLDHEMGGTKAILEVFTPYDCILAKHIALVSREEVEDLESEMAKKWVGTLEKYTFSEQNGVTFLEVQMKTHPDFKEMFETSWPKALETIKELSEA